MSQQLSLSSLESNDIIVEIKKKRNQLYYENSLPLNTAGEHLQLPVRNKEGCKLCI